MSEIDLPEIVERQYRAAFEMLTSAMRNCPEALWLAPGYRNRSWHIAYHALFYTDLYLHPSETVFKPWPGHKPRHESLDALPRPPFEQINIDTPYSREDLLEFASYCLQKLETRIRSVPMDAPSGFSWLRFSRMELHFYNLRHLQHHTAQLIDRMRTVSNIEVAWIGSR